jgi:hypothetical protein
MTEGMRFLLCRFFGKEYAGRKRGRLGAITQQLTPAGQTSRS